ncbi:Lactose phosphotransferase system repressor [Lactobacillus helveticus]|nr:Lactose phosphotransferase system repressor [Lactobacillus helveticus]
MIDFERESGYNKDRGEKRMLTQERQSLIENYVNQHEVCRVSELCDLTDTSESTIRRDLIQMEKNGMLKRVHGGAQSVKNFSRDVSQNVRFNLNHDVKIAIAKYAARNFVQPGDNVFIDAGTTTYELVPFLADIPKVRIITNGVETALCSLNHGIKTILIGGEVKDDTHAVIGQTALAQIRGVNFSVSFVGANGIKKNGNLTTPDPEEAAIKAAEIKQARHAYVLADSSKIGERNFAVFANTKDVYVVTDQLKTSQKAALPADINLEEAK